MLSFALYCSVLKDMSKKKPSEQPESKMGGETERKHGEEKEEGFSVLCEVHLLKCTVCLDKNDSLRFELGVFVWHM